MKVAILAPIAWRTPPRMYGPWEQVASNIAEGLVKEGVDVTLFATGDSLTKGSLEFICENPYCENRDLDPKVWECLHISHMMEQAHRFDIIHNNYDFLPLSYSRLIDTPMVTTIHGFSSPKIVPVYEKYNDSSYYVSISNSDRSPKLNYIATVYNGIDHEGFSFVPDSGNYLLFFGRIHPEKGTHECIRIAQESGHRLIISGLIQDPVYFDEKVKPFVNDDDIIYVGNSGPEARNKLLGEAKALLHPVSFEEPFGLSVVEAMFCGTPVVAFNRGSMPELIIEGKTGFIVSNTGEAIEAVDEIGGINRKDCLNWVMSKFTREKMVEDYLEVYTTILDNQ
jgi:glycosyltransferase involved in cell wall biosynthesis